MKGEKPSLYARLFGTKTFVRQSDVDFLRGCGVSAGSADAELALRIRAVLASYAVPPVDSDQILWEDTIQQDIGLDVTDSLNLADVAVEIEKSTDIRLAESNFKDIVEMNRRNATAGDFVNYLLHAGTKRA